MVTFFEALMLMLTFGLLIIQIIQVVIQLIKKYRRKRKK